MPGNSVSYLDRFSAIAEDYPDRPAVVESDGTSSYAEFRSLVRRLAFAIASAERGPKVLIHLAQSTGAYAAMFAAGYAGAFYTTTNVAAPVERRRGTFDAFDPEVVVTNSMYAAEARAACPAATLIDVDAVDNEELTQRIELHRLAYVMFTSGSTGRPKGVMIPKSALSHYVSWIQAAMSVAPDDRWSQHPNIAFDLSVLDIYGALCGGAALVPIVGADLVMPAEAIRRHALTIWDTVPSVVTSMIKTRQLTPRNVASVRLFTFCGEPLRRMHVDGIFAARPDVVVHNTYGPTEATVSCTLARLTADSYQEACQSSVAIGDPIPGMGIDLVGDCNDSGEGEIVIYGPQLADGYWNDPATTSRQFRTYIWDGVERFGYFTGDWAERAGPHVFFRGRMDNQVKIRGERVELDDISDALMKCGGSFACVVLIGDELHGVFEREVAFEAPDEIHRQLARLLPPHFIPRWIHAIPELPRSPNGKVDLSQVRVWLEQIPSGNA